MPDQLLTLPQVAKILQVSRSGAYLLAARGELPCIRIGRRAIRVHPRDLEAFLESRRSSGGRP